MMRLSTRGYSATLAALVLFLFGSIVFSTAMGAVRIPLPQIFDVLLGRGDETTAQIIRELRLPRVFLGAVIGAALSGAGASLQAVMKSPLADPYILGVSSGASVGASAVVVTGAFTSAFGPAAVTLAAFATGLLSVALVYAAARVDGRVPAIRLLLAGVAWSSFATAFTGFVLFVAPDAAQVRGVIFWMMGGLGATDWLSVAWTAGIALPGLGALYVMARWQDLLLLGDESATALGLHVARARGWIVVVCALVTGAAVAFSGAIGFVGLVVPHVVRPFTGPRHRRLLPASAVLGAVLLVWMDAFARTWLAPRELPVGLLTGLLGAPFFLLLLRRQHRGSDA